MVDYMHIPIPMAISQQIGEIMGLLGYRSVSEFVIEATRRHLTMKQMEYDRRLQELAEKENKSIEV